MKTPLQPLNHLEVFHGEASAALARVYARIDAPFCQPNWSLTGHIQGPYRHDAHTLPTTTPLVPHKAGASLLAEAVIPDPCGWAPTAPNVYQLSVTLRDGETLIQQRQVTTGIRALGTAGPDIFRQGKRCVFRAVEAITADIDDWNDWQSTQATMLVTSPSQELVQQATALGVPLIVQLPNHLPTMEQQLHELAHWPSISLVYTDTDQPMIPKPQQRFPNLLFAQRVDFNNLKPPTLAEWCQVVLWDVGDRPNVDLLIPAMQTTMPVLAIRRRAMKSTMLEDRAECDRLQADLAHIVDCAGYLIMKKK